MKFSLDVCRVRFTNKSNTMAERFEGKIIQSANDKREYRYLTLKSNSLKCILVSDPETEKSAACVNVQVGSLADPKDAQGLAHFLEHMLFMGTEKYPEENAYSAYLSSHGGDSNAYTSDENTVYYFDVQNEYFEGALDLFSTFFTCPLFDANGVSREINAVDSEHAKNIQVIHTTTSITSLDDVIYLWYRMIPGDAIRS